MLPAEIPNLRGGTSGTNMSDSSTKTSLTIIITFFCVDRNGFCFTETLLKYYISKLDDSTEPDQTELMHWLVWIYTGHTWFAIGFSREPLIFRLL